MIKIFYVYDDKENNLGHIDRIEFPDRDAIHFDHKSGTIDLTSLSDYRGFPLQFHSDGEVKKAYIGEVGARTAKQANGEMKEVMGVDLTWEEEDAEE